MGSLMLVKKFSLLFLLVSVSIMSTSYAGRRLRYVSKEVVVAPCKEKGRHEKLQHEDINNSSHGRLLRANTKDYGTYDPSPTFVKPPFKLIPN